MGLPRWNQVKVLVALSCLVWVGLSSAGESTRSDTGERWALLVGINEYQAAGRLQFCREDAQALGKILLDQGGFRPERTVVLVDGGARPEDLPTRGNIRRSVDQFAKLAEPEDTVLVFFSGHGMMAEDETGGTKKGYLMAVDSDRDPANSISIDWLKERLGACKAKTKLLILDVCHAGSAKDVGGLAPSLAAGLASVAVLASCAADEISYVDEKEGHGVFAGRLIEGLAGEADADKDGQVTLAELYAHIKTAMKDWCVSSRKTQTPVAFPEQPPGIALARVMTGVRRPPRLPSGLRVPEGFRAKAGTAAEPYTNTGWAKEIMHEATGIELVFIPAGEFLMGSPASETNRIADETRHRVTLTKPFYMGKYEVTQGEWQKVVGSNPSNFKGSDRLPVEQVSWDDCQAFCQRAGSGLRLPTEAEWEYACRAGTQTPFNTGETISTDQANYNGNYTYGNGRKGEYRQKTVEVGSFRPNAWGLYDMHGNVCERCADWYRDYPGGTVTDPTGPASGEGRVLRGASWACGPGGCRSGSRGSRFSGNRDNDFGFRVVVSSLSGVDLP